ncbi:hypothetical protein [Devosia sediminis]|uniref:Uncharacterized protein n=1 Tax=Devosia sediminis TaxID=2798801 RepID=A0A934IZ43_9HYPH|nr:hypothetical protein [Devosia sediminis]MBJ3784872.1 hypothetical protein [Devosia sediminis]
MAEAAPRQRFLVISNGHGEDAIAAQFIARLPDSITAEAYPVIGSGKAYDGICRIVGPRATLASEGWRNVKGSLRRDIVNGGLMTIPPALKFLRAVRGRYNRIIVVGDMVGVLACLATGNRDLVYIDVYKTGAARLYSNMERRAIRHACALVFCRAENLAALLRQSGIDARAAGNLMMDTIPRGDYDAASRRTQPLAVTLLPGSRALTGESFALQIGALRRIPAERRPDVFLAVAGSVNVEDLARAGGLARVPLLSSEPDDLGTLSGEGIAVHLARGRAMGNLLDQSDVVLSQAGTASIQALGLGKPVITFVNPRDRRSRFEDEQKLFGAARVVVDAEIGNVAVALDDLLKDGAERARLGAIGRERIGGPGALSAILSALGLEARA